MFQIQKNEKGEWQPDIPDTEVYRFLVTYYIYQDKLAWSRTQALMAVEAGVLAASLSRSGWIPLGALVLGSIIVVFIRRLVLRDFQMRDQSVTMLDRVHEPRGVRMAVPAKSRWWKGSFILTVIFYLILLTNFLLLLYVLRNLFFRTWPMG